MAKYEISYTATYETKGTLYFDRWDEVERFFKNEHKYHFADTIRDELEFSTSGIDVSYTSWNFDGELPLD